MLAFATTKPSTHSVCFYQLRLRERKLTQFKQTFQRCFVHSVVLPGPFAKSLTKCQQRVLTLLILLVSLALLLSLRPAEQTTRHQVVYPVVTHTYSEQEMQKTLAFWTPEHMRAAVGHDASSIHSQPVSHSGKVLGLPPALNLSQPHIVGPTNAQLVSTSLYATKLRTVGKLFVIDPSTNPGVIGGGSCSAVSLVSNNHSVVDTAGHCLYNQDKNTWNEDILFCPQYNNGICPVGKWVAKFVSVDAAWKSNHNATQDFGDIAVVANSNGALTDVVGASGYGYDGPQFTNEQAYGYPGNLSNGQVMYSCNGTGLTDPGHNPGLAGIPCSNMEGGSSGGPWFSHDAKGNMFVNGHNDVGAEGLMFSPHYNSEWFAVFNSVQNTKVSSSSPLVSVHTSLPFSADKLFALFPQIK